MKTAEEWANETMARSGKALRGLIPIPSINEPSLLAQVIDEIQSDARAELLQQIEELKTELLAAKREVDARKQKAQEYCNSINELLLERDILKQANTELAASEARLREAADAFVNHVQTCGSEIDVPDEVYLPLKKALSTPLSAAQILNIKREGG